MITERTVTLLKLFQHYQSRHLFTSGGIMDQPNVYIEAMNVLERIANV